MTSPRVFGLVPAAGSGTRFGGDIPKTLVELCGRTVIEWTLEAFLKIQDFEKIIVLVPQDRRKEFDIVVGNGNPRIQIVTGGKTRTESVRKGVEFLREHFSPKKDDIIVIHDGARCLVTSEYIEYCIAQAHIHGAITSATPVSDTIKKVDKENIIIEGIEREGVWTIQTPQVFKFELISKAHFGDKKESTDDSTLVSLFHSVKVVEGSRANMKLTTKEDLEVISTILMLRSSK